MGWKTDAPPLDDLFILEVKIAMQVWLAAHCDHCRKLSSRCVNDPIKTLDKISSRAVFGAYIEIDITLTNSSENTLKSMKK